MELRTSPAEMEHISPGRVAAFDDAEGALPDAGVPPARPGADPG